jgi:hypothetical protein
MVLIISAFIPKAPFGALGEEFTVYFDIIAVFAFILGGGALVKLHGNKIYKRKDGWGYSAVTIVAFIVTLFVGIFKIGNPEGWTGAVDGKGSWFLHIYNYAFVPLGATMFSLLAFFVASASFRAFRAKNMEATILLIAAFIILLGRTFLGSLLTSWLPDRLSFLTIPELASWIMNVPNLAGQRAIMIGIALGVISTSLKIIIGVESSYLGSD